jgi:aryl-alcohol dehydrogenase-like predicted oxidoreductase
METRRLGRTGHQSSVVIFGGAALWEETPEAASAAIDLLRRSGVNHFDIAPSYGKAEVLTGPWLEQHRGEVFLACKTTERTRQGAWDEMRRSMELMRVEHFDLYQLHAVGSREELDAALGRGGAIEALLEAREKGLVDYLGITGHGYEAAAVHAEALERFDFDTVMTPLNFVMWADEPWRASFERLLALVKERDAGLMIIKTFARAPWGDRPQTYNTWYEPFDEPALIEAALRFVLSQPVSGLTHPGDLRLLPAVLGAAQRFTPMTADEQAALVARAGEYTLLFTPG